jgi:3-hydroxybutyryl-CoA dehydrogenase
MLLKIFVDLLDCDFIIEAVNEDYDLKSKIFKDIDRLLVEQGRESDMILASNTSSISLTKLASNVSNPSNFIGMHFMNPVPIMQLVNPFKPKNYIKR